MIGVVVAVGWLSLTGAFPQGYHKSLDDERKCGYDSCPVSQPGKLNVHMVPHTHDDVGWLKTVDQYYFGSEKGRQDAAVQYIIDSVVNELYNNPDRKFIYVETAFFWKWWKEQDEKMRQKVHELVKNGQLEFAGGAWSMNDEATTHYQSTIDQFTLGLRKLNTTFGKCGQPKTGWQIDPFGHSRETASLMAQIGFDGLFFSRLDYQDKSNRLKTKTMEMMWETDSSLGNGADLFTGALYNHYSAPEGFCFDALCKTDPLIADPKSPSYNIDKKVKDFIAFVRKQASFFSTNNIILTMGDDFNYQDAHRYFKNLDILIRHVNELQKNGSEVNVFYSTPSCYLKSLNDVNTTWTTKQDDFFPYATDFQSFWTGYFTSRPTLKFFERQGNNFLQICKQISSLALLGSKVDSDIDALREAMGVMQHHDAITGTEQQHVANDYAKILNEAIEKCETVFSSCLNKLMANDDTSLPPLNFTTCRLTNISECPVSSKSEKFVAVVYNPQSHPVNHIVRLPVNGKSYSVKDTENREIETQIVPIPEPLVSVPGRKTGSKLELVFIAEGVPPLGYKSYHVSATNLIKADFTKELLGDDKEIELGYGDTNFTISTTSGLLISAKFNGTYINLTQALQYYEADETYRPSGAYVFHPRKNKRLSIAEKVNITVYKGPIVSEVHQVFSSWASQVLRHYKGKPYIEVEWLVGPVPTGLYGGNEVVSVFTTNLNNQGVFYTDSNGRQTIKRKRNFRPTWNVSLSEHVSGNYYPVTTDIFISDDKIQMMVITDRAQGGSSLRDGEIELMVHRRLKWDDGFGVREPLDEIAYGIGLIARGRHWIVAGQKSDSAWTKQKRLLRQEKVLSPQVVLIGLNHVDYNQWSKYYNLTYSGLTKTLPPEIHILTLEPWIENTYLLRLEHLLDKTESKKEVTVNLKDLFTAFDIVSVQETSLAADRWLNEVSRLKWNKKILGTIKSEEPMKSTQENFPEVVLKPKQIRTFVCKIKPKTF